MASIVALALGLFLTPGPSSHAASYRKVPEGIAFGPWILAPWLQFDYETDDNVFRQNDQANPEEDRIQSLTLGFDSYLPYRNSMLTTSISGSQLSYAEHSFTRDTDLQVATELLFNFSSQDALVLGAQYTDGFSDVGQIDQGGELVFRGAPYERYRLDLTMQRSVPLRAGYFLRFSYIDQEFDPQETSGFFDYSGYDGSFEYRQPLASYKWIVGYVGLRRFDNFDPGSNVAFRTENAEDYQIGIRGVAGKEQPFVIRLGLGRFNYDLQETSDFSGVTVYAQWRLAVGGRSTLDLTAQRRALPSNFDTHYINMQVLADFSRSVGRYSRMGLGLRWDRNTYGDPLTIGGCGTIDRADTRYDVEGRIDWRLHERFGYQMTARQERRDSNCFQFEYDATVLSAGVRFGWF